LFRVGSVTVFCSIHCSICMQNTHVRVRSCVVLRQPGLWNALFKSFSDDNMCFFVSWNCCVSFFCSLKGTYVLTKIDFELLFFAIFVWCTIRYGAMLTAAICWSCVRCICSLDFISNSICACPAVKAKVFVGAQLQIVLGTMLITCASMYFKVKATAWTCIKLKRCHKTFKKMWNKSIEPRAWCKTIVTTRAGTIQSVSIQYRYGGQPIRIDTVILSYRYTNMVTAAKMKQLFRKESSCFLKTKS